MSKLRLLQESTAADRAWMAEVETVFGKSNAGLARFQGRATGEPGSKLRDLYEQYMKATSAYLAQ